MAFDLSSLLRDVPELDTGREQIEYISLDLLDEDPNNFYELSDLPALADNISLCGLQQPIRVRENGNGRYQIVSGHRRRAALKMLVQDGYEKFREAPCIVEKDAVSPALQELRLIFANSGTRKMTSAEINKQTEKVEKLLYQLKEEGYEFPGRMRDHVAQAVNTSKTKLAKLKVIREHLAPVWVSAYERDLLKESPAYELAQLPQKWQEIIYGHWGLHPGSVHADDVKTFKGRFEKVCEIQCNHGQNFCTHSKTMMEQNVREKYMMKCSQCCFDCGSLQTCGKCCPEARARKSELKATAKQAERESAERQAERNRPYVDMARTVYERVGEARRENRVSVEALFKAQKRFFGCSDEKRQTDYERGVGEFSVNTELPFGYDVRPSLLVTIRNVADALGCSVDFLLGRTDQMAVAAMGNVSEFNTIWHPISEEPPVGKRLVWLDCDGTCDTGRYLGGEQIDEYCVVLWREARWWAELPKEG